ncbi:MAG TPA: hypothetical protein VKB45_14740 [Gemmatimonadales bacterium]|nr:hypothetical protein [Gemmatimonadales bacterium]
MASLVGWARSRAVVRHEAIILVGVLVYFFIGTIDLIGDTSEWSPRAQVTDRVWELVAVGVWGYLAGAWAGRMRGRFVRARPHVTVDRLIADCRKLEVVGWLGLSVLLLIYRAPALTGANREVQSGYLTSLADLLLPAYLLRFAAARAAPARGVWVGAALAGVALLVTGYRSYTLVLWFGLLVVWLVQPRSVVERVKALMIGCVLMLTVGVGYGYVRFLREGTESGWGLVNAVVESNDVSSAQLVAGFTYVSFFREGTSLLEEMVDRHPGLEPYAHGRALWGMITSPLPGKQLDARTILSKEVYGTTQTSLVSTILGPWYLDFGATGVLLGLFLMGYVLSRLEGGALQRGNPVAQAAYAYGFAVTGLSIHTGLSDFTFAVLLPAVFLWASRSDGSTRGPHPESGQRNQHNPEEKREVAEGP